MKKLTYVIVAAVVLLSPCTSPGQGFGTFSKKVVQVNRLLPPTVNLKGKKIWVQATADAVQHDGEPLRALLKTKLITLIQKDPRFILSETSPETVLKFSVTNYYLEEYVTGTGANQHKNHRGKIEVAYQAIDVSTNAALDSENLQDTSGYDVAGANSVAAFLHTDKKREAAAASPNEARDQLVSGIVALMAKRIAPLDQPFEAPLPGGKLEPLSALAQSGRWGALQEQAEKFPPLPKGTDDTYRVYLIALSKEAQAYDLTREANERDLGRRNDITPAQANEEFHRAQKYLDDAGADYKKIIMANSKEKDFRPGDARTEEAIEIYAKIERYKAENAKLVAAKEAAALTATANAGKKAAAGSANPVSGQPTPLEQVVSFCSKGLAVDSIREYIDSPEFLTDAHATDYKFNFARDSLRLSDACKGNASVLQKAMRARLGGPAPSPRKK